MKKKKWFKVIKAYRALNRDIIQTEDGTYWIGLTSICTPEQIKEFHNTKTEWTEQDRIVYFDDIDESKLIWLR